MAAKKGIKIVVKRGTTVDGRAEYFFAAAEQRRVTIGTDGDLCHVVFSAAAFAMIGEEHLELARDAGHYELCLNNRDKVLVDGAPAMDKQEILSTVEIQVGDDGPVLEVTPDSTHSERKASFAVGIPEVMKRQRLSRRVTNIGLAAALLAITVAVYFSFQRDDGNKVMMDWMSSLKAAGLMAFATGASSIPVILKEAAAKLETAALAVMV